jgi:hypothetical protein
VWLYVPSACLPEERDSISDLSSLAQRLEQSVMSRSEFKTQKFWLHGLKKGRWTKRLSGLMCEPSTAQLGVGKWIASLEDFPVRTFPLPEMEQESSKATDPAFGSSMLASFARYNPESSSWKTSALSLFEESTEFSETWPTSGMILNGVAYQRPNVALHTGGKESSSWPTAETELTPISPRPPHHKPLAGETPNEYWERMNQWDLDHPEEAAKQKESSGTWPTPTANDDNKSPEAYRAMRENKLGRKGKAAETISSLQVKVQTWMTPNTRDHHAKGPRLDHPQRQTELVDQALMWKTPHGLGGKDATGKAGGAGGRRVCEASKPVGYPANNNRWRGKRGEETGVGPRGIWWRGPTGTGSNVGNPEELRVEGLRPGGLSESPAPAGPRLSGRASGIFPPGPTAIEEWREILADYPWLAPSISEEEAECTLRGVADELADLVVQQRTDALRMLGNGVVVIQAAAAFTILARRAGIMSR